MTRSAAFSGGGPVYFTSREGCAKRNGRETRRVAQKTGSIMNYQGLERTIGHTFADTSLLELALTHPSYALAHKCQDNQRLEFLGDAVLEICVSRVLYHRYPKLREGQLTRKRAALVCEANLARAAARMGLGSYLKLDRGEEVVGGRENPSILADTMEAIIAAVYLDAGMDKAAALVDLAMDGYKTSEKGDRDAKSALQEYLQALGEETPTYEIIGQDGPPHARVFTARVLRADGTELGQGTGARKQRAEEAAAAMALTALGKGN